jgi:hypothetical protein
VPSRYAAPEAAKLANINHAQFNEQRRLFRIAPLDAGLEVLSGRSDWLPYPWLKPWAIFFSRFAAKSALQNGDNLINRVFKIALIFVISCSFNNWSRGSRRGNAINIRSL